MSDCAKKIAYYSRDKIPFKEAEKLLEEIKESARRAVKLSEGRMTLAEALQDAGIKKLYDNKITALAETKSAVLTRNWKKSIDTFAAEATKNKGVTINDVTTAKVYGSVKNFTGSKDSVAVHVSAEIDAALAQFTVLHRTNKPLHLYITNRENDLDIMKEWNILTGGKEQPTNNPLAREAAKMFNDASEANRAMGIKYGANKRALRGFMGTQKINPEKLVGRRDEWIKDQMDTADYEKMDILPKEAELVFSKIYDETIKERSGGTSDITKRLEASRVIHYKTAEGAIKNRDKYGIGNGLYESFLITLRGNARDVGILRALTPKPQEAIDHLISITDNAQDKVRIERAWQEINGEAHEVVNNIIGNIGLTVRVWNGLRYYGNSGLRSINDLATLAARLHYQGYNRFEAYAKALSQPLKVLKNKEEREWVAASFGVGQRAMLAKAIGYDGVDLAGRTLTKATASFYKVNLQNFVSEQCAQVGLVHATSNLHARQKDIAFDKLPEQQRVTFNQYGITSSMWDSIKQGVIKTVDGDEFVIPNLITDLDARSKYTAMMHDVAGSASNEPDVRVRSLMQNGHKRGTIGGELWFAFMQSKAFSIGSLRRSYMDMHYRGDYASMSHLAISAFLAALASEQMIAAVGGKVLDWSDERLYAKALATSGFGGMAADMTINYYAQAYANESTQEYFSAFLGPTFGDINQIASTTKNFSERNLIPGQNLWFTPALQYLFINDMVNTVNPDFINNVSQRRLKSKSDYFVGRTLNEDLQ